MEGSASENILFLKEAKKTLKKLDDAKQLRSRLSVEDKRLERQVAAAEKALSDEIGSMVRTRKEAITSSYDKELAADQEKLRRLRMKRERAKSQGKAERVREETSELDDETRVLRTRLATLFRQNAIPRFCNSRFFYALYMPRDFWDWVIAVLIFLIAFLAVPCGAFWGFKLENPLVLAGIYFGDITVVSFIYLTVNSRLKLPNLSVLRQGRDMRRHLKSNMKKRRVIIASIRKDRTDDYYDLESYNYEIAKLEAELEKVASRKQEALATFEAVTKRVISDEITEAGREELEALKAAYRENKEHFRKVDGRVREFTIQLTDQYEGYLGKDFLTYDRLDALMEILEQGRASTISEAIVAYRTTRQ